MRVNELADKIKENIEKVIIGKSEVIDLILTSAISGGHVLLEDVPGTGKTKLAKSLAKSIDVEFKRVQFTPDLLPSDLTGINFYNQKLSEFTFRKGPIFSDILLADEINRAAPRTQSSLLECMEERQITVDGTCYRLSDNYFVIATENPIETQGTFPLPEAQLDRFMMKLSMGYPKGDEGIDILKRFIKKDPFKELKPVCTGEDIILAREEINETFVSEDILSYIMAIVEGTRNNDAVELGVSPRGSLALLKCCMTYAAIKDRNFVTPEDVKKLSPYVLSHRLILKDSAKMRNLKAFHIMQSLLSKVPVPTENFRKEG